MTDHFANAIKVWENYRMARFDNLPPEVLDVLAWAIGEIGFMRQVLLHHDRTLPHGKDECDWCSRELKETP